jgi:prepilin-type N-terminal cleavage/methylation domain-containing protein
MVKKNMKKVSLKLRASCRNKTRNNSGFTLLELLVVVLLIGVLAAIAAPGWLAFTNRQRLNKANDIILGALQEAQREAKRTKLNYSVSFATNSNIPQVAVYTGSTPSNWRNLSGDLQIRQILLGTNLTSQNTAGTSVTYNSTTPATITFDQMGTLPNANFGNPPGLKIVVAIPQSGSTTQPSAVKRCVIVSTLLGAMVTAKDNQCN